MDKIRKSGQFRGLTSWRGREGGLDKPRVHRGIANLRRDEGLRRSVAVLCRGVALFTDMCFFFFSYFAISLFQRLVYWTNEDPISV